MATRNYNYHNPNSKTEQDKTGIVCCVGKLGNIINMV